MDIDPSKNFSVPFDWDRHATDTEREMKARGLPTDPCAHLIYQPMPYCVTCRAHLDAVALTVAARMDARALEEWKDVWRSPPWKTR